MKKVDEIRCDDINWLNDINSFMNYIFNELIVAGVNVTNPIPFKRPNKFFNHLKNNRQFFVGQIETTKEEERFSLRFVFNKRGSFSFGLFSLYKQYPENKNQKNSLKIILFKSEMNCITFYENFLKQINNVLI